MKAKLTHELVERIRPKSTDYTVWDSATPHFGLRIRPAGSKRFVHVAVNGGKLKKTTIGDAAKMTLDVARGIALDLNAGTVEENPPCPAFRDWVDEWWQQTSPRYKLSTLKGYRSVLARQLLPAFGDMRLDDITRPVIERWFANYSRKSPGGANHSLTLLGTILNHAMRAQVCAKNPVRRIRRNPSRKMTRTLSVGERERLLAAIEAVPSRNRTQALAVKMLLLTGCRKNEITTLRWEEVGDGVLNLADSKTGARRVWLGAEARDAIDEARARQESPDRRSAYVFPNPLDRHRCLGSLDRVWTTLRKRAGITDVRLHDLRHSFASEAVRQNIPIPVVSKLLGHSSIRMTMRYVHANEDEIDESAELIAERLAGFLRGEEPREARPGSPAAATGSLPYPASRCR